MVSLNVTQNAVSLSSAEHGTETTRALVAACMDGFRVGIMSVGQDESAIRSELAKRAPVQRRGLAGKILAAARTAEDESPATDSVRFVKPGDDPWWDRKWQNEDELRAGDPRRAQNPRQILLFNPLSPDSWSPHFIRGVLMYVLWTSPHTRDKTWPAFRRPKLELHVTADLTPLQYEELVDQLRNLWGESRIVLAADRPVAPPPVTAMQRLRTASRAVFWTALMFALLLNLGTGKTSKPVLLAASLAALAVFVSRFARGRMISELPRRQKI